MRRALVIAMLAWAGSAFASERYDPRLQFRSLRTPHFTIHFSQGLQHQAERLAAIAEEVHASLSPALLAAPARHTHVILVDQHDDANGWATPLPFNTIEISAAAPGPSAPIGHTDDWLRLVFTHEYTHILHLDRARGLVGGLRRVFGRAPVLFPNLFLPGWNVEGLATFYETRETGAGRLRSGGFRTIVAAAAAAGVFDPIDRATGVLVDWPGGNAAYAYGATFHEYLAERYGAEAFARLADATSGRVPYMPGAAFKRVFGRSARDLWEEFAGASRRDAAASARPGTPLRSCGECSRLTSHGYSVSGPRWLADGSLLYTVRTPHEFPSLMLLPPGGTPRRVASRYQGERAAVRGAEAFFDQRELARSVALQNDLYVLDLRRGGVRRLTHGARATDPDVSPDGRALVAVAQRGGTAALVRFPIDRGRDGIALGAAHIVAGGAGTQFGGPRWSPDAGRIAAERRRAGELPHVAVVDAATGNVLLRVIADQGRLGEPEWIDDRRLIVTWEPPAAAPVLCRIDLTTGESAIVAAPPDGARAAAFSRETGRIAYVGYTPEGYDLFALAATDDSPAAGPAVVRVVTGDVEPPEAIVAPRGSTPYRPSSIAPRFWMPIVQTDEDHIEFGAGTVGIDALGRHGYASTVRWSDRARPDWDLGYAYDRWRPSLFVAASDDVTVWQDQDYRETSVDAGVSLSFRTVRRRQVLFGAFHATREEDPQARFDRRSVRGGYQVSTARRYGYSISPEDGVTLGGTIELTRRALGADADVATASFDARAFPRLGGGHRVLSLRAAAAASWGDRDGRRVLGAGGSAAPAGAITFGRDAIGLARGFPEDEIVGYRAAVLNVDYRLPLATIERGLGTLPIFVRQLHAAAFVDAAHAWSGAFRARDARTSAGLELSSDVVLGHYLPLTLTAGVAWRRDPSGAHEGAAVFGRIGAAF